MDTTDHLDIAETFVSHTRERLAADRPEDAIGHIDTAIAALRRARNSLAPRTAATPERTDHWKPRSTPF